MANRIDRKLALLLSPLGILLGLAVYAKAGPHDPLAGQWTGRSQIDGDRLLAKTELTVRSDPQEVSLTIEGAATCKLRNGSVHADPNGAWSIAFANADGGDDCMRLVRAAFNVRRGPAARTLLFDVTYPGADGQPATRRGALQHYP
ncbi:MAG TPA: hypothetical protein VF132_06575 [Rudaea sp.]